ncbi:adaptor protein MecA [Bacillus hwajinpoensis]|jgi:adapter protein MecA 1/2|uniref:Adapter protein MecA n=1 Tax=Guptibacillus hwajinpoensis TaxID=208199 RepID=A0A845EYD5_9BACL|nr:MULTISPECIES: adaptor protein MecA [Bacillaceae]MCA0989978.1 adaptor protein MecA [Pseudalkalibacillus hwajinpoensis]MYL63528.1 adaptor protein MecA [Pseudalkalibacillus hwajinpoensis]QHA94201.1 adaptor protein MecA [Bacillus sp. N1-1]
MEIERVNANTLKFFITYRDIENRGFDREEIWYDRERGEELFWEMMDEAHQREQFSLEGPLWIQVQALEKGLEIIVTRAQMSNDGSKLELPISEEKQLDLPLDENMDKILDDKFALQNNYEPEDEPEPLEGEELSFMIAFRDFEDVISLSHGFDPVGVENGLYHYEDRYYLHVVFDDTLIEEDQDNRLSQLLEYGYETELTIHRIQEYGKEILSEEALEQLRGHFPLL